MARLSLAFKRPWHLCNISQKIEKNRNFKSDGNVPLPAHRWFRTSHCTAVAVGFGGHHHTAHFMLLFGPHDKFPTMHQQTLTICHKTGNGIETMTTFKIKHQHSIYWEPGYEESYKHQESEMRPQKWSNHFSNMSKTTILGWTYFHLRVVTLARIKHFQTFNNWP